MLQGLCAPFFRRQLVETRLNVTRPPVVRKSFWRALALTLVVAALNIGLWGYLNRPVHIAD